MAIDAVISHRNFGSFIASGHQTGERSSIDATHFGNYNMNISETYPPQEIFSFSLARILPQNRFLSRDESFITCSSFQTEANQSLSVLVPHQLKKKLYASLITRKISGISRRHPSLAIPDRIFQSGKFENFGFTERQVLLSKRSTMMRTRADFKSEELDIRESELESLVSAEGVSGAVFLEGVEGGKPWWEQFPKRW